MCAQQPPPSDVTAPRQVPQQPPPADVTAPRQVVPAAPPAPAAAPAAAPAGPVGEESVYESPHLPIPVSAAIFTAATVAVVVILILFGG